MILEEQGERLHEETIPIKAAEIQTERKTRVIKMSGISGDWYEALKGEFSKPYYRTLFQTVNEEYRTRLIFPPAVIYALSDFLIMILSWLVKRSLRAFLFQEVQP